MKIKNYLLLGFACFAGMPVFLAQQNFTIYNMERVHQSFYHNPSHMPMGNVNIGLPLISSLYFNMGNNGFRGKDILKTESNDSLYITPGNMLSKLKKHNYLSFSAHIDLLHIGFKVKKKSYISLTAIEKVDFRLRYPKDFFMFLWEGNGSEGVIGKELLFDFGIDLTHYREYGLAFAHQLNDRLSFGLRFKYLYGMENLRTEKTDITFYTDPDNFALTASSDIKINSSGLDSSMETKFDDIPAYMFQGKNTGFGGDLGLSYSPLKKLTLSVSLVDFGFIKWKQNINNTVSSNPGSSFTFRGIGMKEYFRDSASLEDAFNQTLDTLGDVFMIEEEHSSYTTRLSTQIYAGMLYNFTKKTSFGAMYHSQFFDGRYHPGFSMSLNSMLRNWLSGSISYSAYNRSFLNIGAGFSAKLGPTQIYVVSDNIMGAFYPMSTKNANIRLGLNITVGKGEKPEKKEKGYTPTTTKVKKADLADRDNDGVIDLDDLCPDNFGLIQFRGCPDKDNDSIPDKDDDCPEIAGMISLHGCPDKDGDEVPDMRDSCPDTPGLSQYSGCPDRDGDGIQDKFDDCDTVPGIAKFKGCPDRDFDNIKDAEDACPDEPGLIANKGCPDSDSDGIIDSKDRCPDRPGTITFKGCPDSDLDGLADPDDECPDQYGDKSNKGCPLVKVAETFKSADAAVNEQDVLRKAFENLTFQTGKTTIGDGSLLSLDALAGAMKANISLKLLVSGHTDNVGKAASNLKLSENRAKAVKDYLVTRGVNPDQITTRGLGSAQPVSDNKTPEGKAKNRRVELKFIQ